jgi:ribosomal protein L11 methyltransferase
MSKKRNIPAKSINPIAAPSAAGVIALLEIGGNEVPKIADLIAADLETPDVAVSLWEASAGQWRLAIHAPAAADRNHIRAAVAAATGAKAARTLRFEQIEATDWIRESVALLKPVRAGRFVVHGAHDRAAAGPNRIGIEIEAALAFGTGHHGTTRGCLVTLDRLCKLASKQRQLTACPSAARGRWRGNPAGRVPATRATDPHPDPRKARIDPHPFGGRDKKRRTTNCVRILDVGTGTGLLAIAAARTLRRRVLATDNDPAAVRVARDNARRNRAGMLIDIVKANGVTARSLRDPARFDLIFANILLTPLQRMASSLLRLTTQGGRIVLSGLLPKQANAALAAYRPLALERRIDLDGWTTLVLRRGSDVAPCRPRS